MLPLRIAVDLLQPSPPIESSLHLMLIPFVQIRHRSIDLACHPGLGPLLKTVRVQGTTTAVTFVTVAVRKNAIWNDLFLATRLATVEGPVHGDPLLLNDWNFHGSHLRNTRCDSHQGGHLRNTRCDSHQEGHPLQENGIRIKRVTLSKRMGFAPRGSPSPKRMGFASRGSPSPKRMGFASTPSTANGICFKGVPFSTANGICIKRATLSKTNGIRTKRVTLSKRMGFASRGSPSPKRMGFVSDSGPSCSKRPLSRDSSPRPRYSRNFLSPKGFASVPKRMGFASRDFPSPKRQRFESGDSDSPRRRHSFRASFREASVETPVAVFSHPSLFTFTTR